MVYILKRVTSLQLVRDCIKDENHLGLRTKSDYPGDDTKLVRRLTSQTRGQRTRDTNLDSRVNFPIVKLETETKENGRSLKRGVGYQVLYGRMGSWLRSKSFTLQVVRNH